MSDFAVRLKFFRSLKGLSQAELASLVGISGKQVSDYEVGASNPRKGNYKKILDALGVTEIEFMNSNCLFEGNGKGGKNQLVTAMAMILASPSRGQLISIAGKGIDSSNCHEISVNIYSGTITRTKQIDENYINVYYLTGENEECICVHKENFDEILKYMKNDLSQNT